MRNCLKFDITIIQSILDLLEVYQNERQNKLVIEDER